MSLVQSICFGYSITITLRQKLSLRLFLNIGEETQGWFCKRTVWANVPSFWFLAREQPNIPSSRFLVQENIRRNHPFANPELCTIEALKTIQQILILQAISKIKSFASRLGNSPRNIFISASKIATFSGPCFCLQRCAPAKLLVLRPT